MKPEWKEIGVGNVINISKQSRVFWCKGCGCLKIESPSNQIRYKVPRRERQRRLEKKVGYQK